MYTITVSEKGGQQTTFEFNKPEVTIGRMKGNDIVLPKGNVSKRHSRIFAQEGAFSIMDLDSTNGTYVNGRRIQGEQNVSGVDKIYIGDFILQVEIEGLSAPPPAPGGPANQSGLNPPPPTPPPMDNSWNPTPPSDSPSPRAGVSSSGVQQHFEPMPPPSSDHAPIAPNGSGLNPPPPNVPPLSPLPLMEEVVNQDASPFDQGSNAFADSVPPAANQLDVAPSPPLGGLDLSGPALSSQPIHSPDPLGSTAPPSVQINIAALTSQEELESDFDDDFHSAQLDVTRVLFEKLDASSLPINYPPEAGELDRYSASVESAVNTVDPSADRDGLINLIAAECVGLGPIEAFLDDPEIDAIYVHRYDQIVIRKGGSLRRAAHCFSNDAFLDLAAARLFGPANEQKVSDEVRFEDGTTVHVSRPPLTANAVFTIRKPKTYHPSLDELASENVMTNSMAEFLKNAVVAGRSILVAGPTDSGKTTLLSALTKEVGPGARVVAVEAHRSLDLPEFAIRFEAGSSGPVTVREAIGAALATRPHRLILDECSGAEAYDWVTAAACGTDGSMLSLHGMNARDALGRLETLSTLGAGEVSPRGLREQIARSVSVVVVVNRTHDGFRVQQIADVQGVDLDAYRMQDVYYFRTEGGTGSFHPTGHIPLFYEDLRHAGIEVDFSVFRE